MKILLKTEPFRRAHEEYERCMENELERHWALAREMFQRDAASRLKGARDEGRREGREEGARAKAEETARKLLAAKVAIDTIVEWTGLSVKEVEAIRQE